jgi:3'-5' exonuclease
MSQLIFDIETIGDDFDSLDQTTQEVLTHWLKHTSHTDVEYEAALKDLKAGMGFSPLTGQIVAIGVIDGQKEQGCVYFQAPGETIQDFEENNVKYRCMTEKDMLQKFWELAGHYDEFVTFNGRAFDAPFLVVRSAVNKIKPSKDLLASRYMNYQRNNAKHIDLFDQLTFYGAVRHKSSLHLWARAFGIESPKAAGVKGDDVAGLFKEKKFIEIAKYNALDIKATKELYHYWNTYIRI